MTKRFIVALEGIDGSGKSYCGKQAVNYLDARYAHTPSMKYSELRRYMGQYTRASFLMYLSSCALALEQYNDSSKSMLLVDRFWFSSLLQYAWNNNRDINIFLDLLPWIQKLLPAPDLTIFCHADKDVRVQRISARQSEEQVNSAGERFWWQAVAAVQLDEAFCYELFDTSSISEGDDGGKELAMLIADRLGQNIGSPPALTSRRLS